METVRAVVLDLFQFVFVDYFGFRSRPSLPAPSAQTLLPTKSVTSVTPIPETVTDGGGLSVAVTDALLFSAPVAAFDGVVERLPYGTLVTHLATENRWYKVRHNNNEGWVLRESVVDGKVTPQFLLGEHYDAQHEETIKLRAYIGDTFFASSLDAPLQAVEFVTYRLMSKRLLIEWPKERPRTAGRWQQLLRGQPGIHMGVIPKTNSIMEVVHEDGTGHVAYVEAVFPDDSIVVSEVGWPEEGQYSERTLPKEEWRELRPIFITVS